MKPLIWLRQDSSRKSANC